MNKEAVYGIRSFAEAKEKIGIGGILACLLGAPFLMTNCFVGTGLALMYVEFADIPEEVISLIITIPSLCSVVFATVGGQWAQKVPVRKVFIIAGLFNIIGGILPVFLNNIYVILATRVIYGIGFGLAFSLGSSLISMVYGGDMKKRMLGFSSAIGMAICFLFIWISVALMNWKGWRGTFYGYLVLVPFLVFMYFCMPKNVPPAELAERGIVDPDAAPADGAAPAGKLTITPLIVLFFVLVCVQAIAGMASGTYLGAYMMTDCGIDSVTFGWASNLSMIAQMLMGFAYPYVQKVCKQYTVAISLVFMSIGYFMLLGAQTGGAFCLANFIAFIGSGTYNPASVYVLNQITKPEERGRMIGIHFSITGIGQFVTAFALTGFAMVFGFKAAARAPFLSAAILLAVLAVAYFVGIVVVGKQKKAKGETFQY